MKESNFSIRQKQANCHIRQMLNYFNYVPSTAMARIKTANITLRSKAFEIGDILNFQQKQKKSQLLTPRVWTMDSTTTACIGPKCV